MTHSNWENVPPVVGKYWHPGNRGFTNSSAEFRCSQCEYVEAFSPKCPFCGSVSRVLASGTGLPGIFCESCKEGAISWTCKKCNTARQIHLCFFYDPSVHKLAEQSRCFIATACTEPRSWEVIVLSIFRDKWLTTHKTGRVFIRFYETVSPPLARCISTRPFIRRTLARFIIGPIAHLVAKQLKKKGVSVSKSPNPAFQGTPSFPRIS